MGNIGKGEEMILQEISGDGLVLSRDALHLEQSISMSFFYFPLGFRDIGLGRDVPPLEVELQVWRNGR